MSIFGHGLELRFLVFYELNPDIFLWRESVRVTCQCVEEFFLNVLDSQTENANVSRNRILAFNPSRNIIHRHIGKIPRHIGK